MLTLIRAGLYTSVQDAGRFGMRQSGVSYCGALDRPALEIANVLVGNPGNTAALEITLGQCVIEFSQETWFALTGAGCDATLDGKAVWTGWRLRAKAGQRLTLKRPQHGVRSYLAVAGGIDVPEVLGSSSTDQKAGIGGARRTFVARWRSSGDKTVNAALFNRAGCKTAPVGKPDPRPAGAGVSGI